MTTKLPKNYVPNSKEKYMSPKQREFFRLKLLNWKNEIIQSDKENINMNQADTEISAPDIVDQASSQTEQAVKIREVNRGRKLLSKIDQAIERIKNNTYGYCEETGEPIGIKRLIARPIATLTIEAQEKHEKNEKIFVDT
tara:strand:- start:717 stop:1136 length:420 start_codon:yes stop_codon:yes gene_type:complete